MNLGKFLLPRVAIGHVLNFEPSTST